MNTPAFLPCSALTRGEERKKCTCCQLITQVTDRLPRSRRGGRHAPHGIRRNPPGQSRRVPLRGASQCLKSMVDQLAADGCGRRYMLGTGTFVTRTAREGPPVRLGSYHGLPTDPRKLRRAPAPPATRGQAIQEGCPRKSVRHWQRGATGWPANQVSKLATQQRLTHQVTNNQRHQGLSDRPLYWLYSRPYRAWGVSAPLKRKTKRWPPWSVPQANQRNL